MSFRRAKIICSTIISNLIKARLTPIKSAHRRAFILIRYRTHQCRSTLQLNKPTHPPAGRLLLQTGAPLPVAAVLVQTGQAGTTVNLAEIPLFEWLKHITTQALDDELDKILSVPKSAF